MNMNEQVAQACSQAASLIGRADGLLITAGAGMGVDSGLPDFRGPQGFWNQYPALAEAKLDYSEIAARPELHNNPVRAWGFWGHSLKLYRETAPNEGFGILRRWGEKLEKGCFVMTSNVDGQFQKAGFDANRIHEIHGSVHRTQCTSWKCEIVGTADDLQPRTDDRNCRWLGDLPMCACGEMRRPNVFMFVDGPNWREGFYKEQQARLERWLDTTRRLVVIEIGAGGAVPTIRKLGERIAQARGGHLVRINPRLPRVPRDEDVSLALTGTEALRLIDSVLVGATA
jgi:NAD-dependent SIR2 family protein deacetylase